MAVNNPAENDDWFVLKGVKLSSNPLGQGAFSLVYKAEYCGTPCAVKVLRPNQCGWDENELIRRFFEECYRCSRLRHPNVVQFLGIFYHDGVSRIPLIVMELMAHTLTKFVSLIQIPIQLKFSIAYNIALGLCYLHNNNILHRDLSPNNVLLTSQLVAKISDLGIAKVMEGNITKLSVVGTEDFMPPEAKYLNCQSYSLKFDLFSLGTLILHIFTQQWPRPSELYNSDRATHKRKMSWDNNAMRTEIERRKKYLAIMDNDKDAAVLLPFVMKCLNNSPTERPHIEEACEEIKKHVQDGSSDILQMYQQYRDLQNENEQLKMRLQVCLI